MKYLKIILILVIVIFFPVNLFAQKDKICSPVGYSVFTINGIFTNKKEAGDNKTALEKLLPPNFNNQPITVDFLHNPSHIAGLGDLAMAAYQKIFDYEAVNDYDLVEMLKDASEKVKTQKLLLVAHSQGNFYANSFYDTVAGKDGGVPQESIGVYAVATPAGRVAGEGKWLTSDTDKVIVDLVGLFPFKKIMAPNTSIALDKGDDSRGHNFSGVYLKYRGKEIISGIRETLGRLTENNPPTGGQNQESPCLSPPKLTLVHKIQGEILSAVDPAANMAKDGIIIVAVGAYQVGKALVNGASSLAGLFAGAYASLLPEDGKSPAKIYSLWVGPEENIEIVPIIPPSRQPLDIAEESLNILQNQILALKDETTESSSSGTESGATSFPPSSAGESVSSSGGVVVSVNLEPKFSLSAGTYSGFGGGGESPASSSESSSSSVSESSSASSFSSAPAPDTTPPELSLSISECQNSLSSDGCLVATTTLNITWSSPSSDLDYFVINNNGSVSATTSTSTVVVVSDNAIFSFAVSAKDLAGNFSATSTQTAEISTIPVVINEVAWAGNGSAYSADEWIELYNRTNKSVNLSDWILHSATDLSPYVALTGTISAKGYYLLERTSNDTVSDITADKIYTGALNNSGENLILSHSSSTIDEVPYDYNWYAGSDFNYSSMERYDASSAGTSSSNWLANNTVIINGKNAGGGNINGTPKARNSANYLINRGVSVSSDMTLHASSSPYLVNNALQTFSASSTLTIESGVVIKFYNDAGFQFISGAKILAQGSVSSPIIFTSFYDDVYAGDTNGDGSSASPTYGNWFGVRIDSPGTESIISNSVFRYGGKYYSGGGWTDSKANLYVTNSSANISDSVFEYGKVYGVRLSSASATFSGSAFRYNNNSEEGDSTGLYSSVGTLTLNSNTFSNNKRGLYILGADSASISSNIFTSNTGEAVYSSGALGNFSGNSGSNNSVNGIVVSGNLTTANSTTTLGLNSLPYVIKTYDASVVANSALVIPSGAVLKADKRLNVNGNLSIIGSSPGDVILTSLYDDTAGGDATNNGSTTPSAGGGGWIAVSNAGNFAGSGFTARYGGSYAHNGNNSAWLSFDSSGGSISNALFDNNYPYGIYAANSPGLTIFNTSFSNHSFNGDWGTKSALSTIASTITLSAVSFTNNALGVLSSISTFIADNVTFTNNTATTSPGGLW